VTTLSIDADSGWKTGLHAMNKLLVHPTVAPHRLGATTDLQWKARVFHAFMLMTRLALGGVLGYAGLVKALDTAAFADAIANYELLPPPGYRTLAVVLPWVEMGLGLFLVCELFLRASALLSMLLCLLFSGAVLSAMVRGLDIGCGCFGSVEYVHVGLSALALDLAMITASTLVLIFPRQSLALRSHAEVDRTGSTRRGTPRR
jgi:putative oxidoreductase